MQLLCLYMYILHNVILTGKIKLTILLYCDGLHSYHKLWDVTHSHIILVSMLTIMSHLYDLELEIKVVLLLVTLILPSLQISFDVQFGVHKKITPRGSRGSYLSLHSCAPMIDPYPRWPPRAPQTGGKQAQAHLLQRSGSVNLWFKPILIWGTYLFFICRQFKRKERAYAQTACVALKFKKALIIATYSELENHKTYLPHY